MNLTRAELHAPCNTEEAARTRPVQPKPRPVQPFNTVRVELSTPRAIPKISAHASGTLPVLMTRATPNNGHGPYNDPCSATSTAARSVRLPRVR